MLYPEIVKLFAAVNATAATPAALAASRFGLSLEQGVHECPRLEVLQILGRLADADEADGDLQLFRDRHHDTAAGGPVQLRQREAGHADRLVELSRLGERVLARGRVEHEQHLMRRSGQFTGEDPLHLSPLIHEIRLHTKTNLMDELRKMKRVLARELPGAPHEVLLVLDATTGQNALSQARQFHEAVGVTGLALTKLDGTARGGIVVAIAEELKIHVRLIGVGEAAEDLQDFQARAFVDALFEGKAKA